MNENGGADDTEDHSDHANDGHGQIDGHGDSHDHDGHDHDDHDDHDHDDHDERESDDSHDHHHRHDRETLGVAVVTVSSSRDPNEDPSGDVAVELFENAGHEIAARELVTDDHDLIQETVNNLIDREPVDVVITTGGTGVTPDDVTPEAVTPLLDKQLPGFGELFRKLSYDEIGTMVVATRAIGGIAEDVPLFSLPGSTNAVRLGVEEIILSEVGHLAGLASRESE